MIRRALIVAAALCALQFVAPARAKADSQATFEAANAAYDKGSYAEARKGYESLLAAGVDHEVVFYNLGNTYFRQGQLGRAITDTTISGVAFDMLKSITMVSDQMSWSCAGMCGKKQIIPVGMGGPAVKCRIHIGGQG